MKNIDRSGFTIVELIAVIAITGLMVVAVFAFYESILGTTLKAELDVNTTADRMAAANSLRNKISESSGLTSQPSISDPNGPLTGGLWPEFHPSDNNQSHLPSPINDMQPILYFRTIAYNSSQQPLVQPNGQFHQDEHVLYRQTAENRLFIRTLANTVAGNAERTTCPSASATATCPADQLVLNNVERVDFNYFSKTGEVMNYYQVINDTDPDCASNPVPTNPYCQTGPDFEVVEVVEIRPNLSAKARLQQDNTSQSETVIRVALRNQ